MQDLIEKISRLLKEKQMKIATAESCTGGLLGHSITNIPGSSQYYQGGVISYSNDLKMQLLGVTEETLLRHGAVSEETAREMADGLKRAVKADICIATTGIAGPGGGTAEKPVGLVYIALSANKNKRVNKYIFKGTRVENKRNTCKSAFKMVLNYLEKYD